MRRKPLGVFGVGIVVFVGMVALFAPFLIIMSSMFGAAILTEARVNIQKPPSEYLRSFYYDCLTDSEPALRFLMDMVGADRVLLGSDWPFDMAVDSPVEWINGMDSLDNTEKEAIISKNLTALLEL